VYAEQWNFNTKGWAFLVTAGVQVIITIGCYACAMGSIKQDKVKEQEEIAKQTLSYQRVQEQPN